MSVYFANSSSNYLSIASALGITGTNYARMTILMWVRLHASATGTRDDQPGGGRDGSVNTNSGFWFSGNATAASRRIKIADGSNSNIDATQFDVDTWYCLAWRKPGTSYWNAPIGSRAVVGGAWTHHTGDNQGNMIPASFEIGRGNIGGSGNKGWYGYIAACRVWSTDLTNGELDSELAATSVAPVKTANLRADWQFANGAETTDSSGNGYTLTSNGTVVYDAGVPSSWESASNTTITPSVGSLILTGNQPSVLPGTVITPSVGALTLTGVEPTVRQDLYITPPVATITLTGLQPTVTLNAAVSITPNTGALTTAGAAPSLLHNIIRDPSVGSLTLSGLAPTVAQSPAPNIVPSVGALTLTGNAPTIGLGQTIYPATGSMTLTGVAPSMEYQLDPPATAALTLTGVAPTVAISDTRTAAPATGAMSFAGVAPSVNVNTPIMPDTGSLTLAGVEPTVSAGSNVVAFPGTGALTLTGLASTVESGDNAYRTPTAGALTLSGVAPTLSVTDLKVPAPATGTATLTGAAPTVAVTNNVVVFPDTGALILNGRHPGVNGVYAGEGGLLPMPMPVRRGRR